MSKSLFIYQLFVSLKSLSLFLNSSSNRTRLLKQLYAWTSTAIWHEKSPWPIIHLILSYQNAVLEHIWCVCTCMCRSLVFSWSCELTINPMACAQICAQTSNMPPHAERKCRLVLAWRYTCTHEQVAKPMNNSRKYSLIPSFLHLCFSEFLP